MDSVLCGDSFSLRHLSSLAPVYLERRIRESIRAVFCHWMMIFPGFFFCSWDSPVMGWAMVACAALNDFFPILARRFNRPRLAPCWLRPGALPLRPALAWMGLSPASRRGEHL